MGSKRKANWAAIKADWFALSLAVGFALGLVIIFWGIGELLIWAVTELITVLQ